MKSSCMLFFLFISCLLLRPMCGSTLTLIAKKFSKREPGLCNNIYDAIERDNFEAVEKYVLEPGVIKPRKDGFSPLHYACSLRRMKIVDYLLSNAYSKRSPCKNGRIPLHIAIQKDSIEIVKKLLDENPHNQVFVKDDFGKTALHFASAVGNVGICNLLLEAGANINEVTKKGETALHLCVQHNHLEVCKCIVKTPSCKIDLRDCTGCTPFYHACAQGNEKICRLLLEKGVNYTLTNKLKRTPLHAAAEGGHVPICKILLVDMSCNVNSQDSSNVTPLLLACEVGKDTACAELLKNSADINASNDKGETPLHSACNQGNQALCELLLGKKNLQVCATNSCGETALHLAARNKQDKICKALISKESKLVNIRNRQKETPLHLACERGAYNVVYALLYSGQADALAKNEEGATPLTYACKKGHADICQLLLKFQKSIQDDNDKLDSPNINPLLVACRNRQLAICEILLSNNFSPDMVTGGNGESPLHVACEKGDMDLCRYFITTQKDLCARDKDDNTPLHYACMNERLDCVKLLLEHDEGNKVVEVNAQNKDQNKTALMTSLERKYEAIARLLVRHGAFIGEKDLEIAKRFCSEDLQWYLQKRSAEYLQNRNQYGSLKIRKPDARSTPGAVLGEFPDSEGAHQQLIEQELPKDTVSEYHTTKTEFDEIMCSHLYGDL